MGGMMLRKLWEFFVSLRTAFGFFLAGIVLCFIGSLMLSTNLAFFSGINDTPLFKWLADSGAPAKTWWIWTFAVLMALLSLSTILCTVDALVRGMNRKNLLLMLSPQVMHIGVLFVLLGHLLSAWLGIKEDISIKPGELKALAPGIEVRLTALDVTEDEQGYFSDWRARLTWVKDGVTVQQNILRPVHPVYFEKTGLIFRSITMGKDPSALIRAIRDPGAIWALIGGILITLGALGYVYAKRTVPD